MPKEIQSIDRLILGIKSITQNRFSLLDEDIELLNETIEKLEEIKSKLDQNDHTKLIAALKVMVILAKIFFSNEHHS
jgi:hypothetical protein